MVCFGGILQLDGVAPRTSVLVLVTWRTACLLSAGELYFLIHLHLVLSLENQETKGMPRNLLRHAAVAVMSEAVLNWKCSLSQ